MRASELDTTSGLLPPGVRGLSLRGVERDLFCWVWTVAQAEERLVALPEEPAQARRELATTLEREHGFLVTNAELATGLLFERAFPEGAAETEAGQARSARLNLPEYPESRRAAQRA